MSSIRCGRVCSAIFWAILLIFIVWPIALCCSIIWVLLQPFEPCCRCMGSINSFLERLVTWPRECGYAIDRGSEQCPAP